MFKLITSTAVAIALFAAPLIAQTHDDCNSVAMLAHVTAENRDDGISLRTLIRVLESNPDVNYENRPALTQLVTQFYNMGLPPANTYQVVYNACMGT